MLRGAFTARHGCHMKDRLIDGLTDKHTAGWIERDREREREIRREREKGRERERERERE